MSVLAPRQALPTALDPALGSYLITVGATPISKQSGIPECNSYRLWVDAAGTITMTFADGSSDTWTVAAGPIPAFVTAVTATTISGTIHAIPS